MKCPKCGARVSTMKGVDTDWNERYRQYKCTNTKCNKIFFTIEFVAAETEEFEKEWSAAVKKRVESYSLNSKAKKLKGEKK